jgi:putative transposase
LKKFFDICWLAIRTGNEDKPITLSDGPLELPKQWHRMVNNLAAIDDGILSQIEKTIKRGTPLGDDDWIVKTVGQLGLESTILPRGRPRKETDMFRRKLTNNPTAC